MTRHISGTVHKFTAAAALLGLALFASGSMPSYCESAQVSNLLQQARTSAVQLKDDSVHMESYARSKVTWNTHAQQISQIKEHINKSGEILAKLHDARDNAEPWQQNAIDEITPRLKDLASNTEAIIDELNGKKQTWHPEYTSYLKSNAETATDLANLIRDHIEYGEAKARTERIGKNLGLSGVSGS